ncbi:hypothetical protein TNCV_4201631 [Trichonephila clavipes]|uniref:Uncharacterized protein n=1 Tax=Trichonephila clavipes TaxID=2585209 RepID=A0A8X6WBU1_TRICX|nr:hypothetical protein TNCV_4201631 [Trichonephila clavipes]
MPAMIRYLDHWATAARGDVDTYRSDSEGSRTAQAETEDGERAPSLQEANDIKKRPHGSHKWRKKQVPQSLASGPDTREMTRREAADKNNSCPEGPVPVHLAQQTNDERQALSGRSNPCQSRSTETANDRQVLTNCAVEGVSMKNKSCKSLSTTQ